ncbi:MAG TPA: YpdA family putative bacillithiol disulfide reductase [Longimicrobiales bacterium]|nr:YpdA family putative bacillithiol disulfide reductase [Longimicrobiales bacterium]
MKDTKPIDLAVVGAGPCGLSAAVAASRTRLSSVVFDKGCITRSIALYPTYGTFFSTPDRLELGGVPFIIQGEKPTRLDALKYYRRIVQEFELDVRQYTEVLDIQGALGDFALRTRSMAGEEGVVRALNVLVATGYADSPNWIGVRGEDLPKVTHYYTEGHPYYDQDCVVIGGGNSAVEAALDLFRAGARVTLVHFLDGLDSGVKPWILPDIQGRLDRGEIRALWRHRVIDILPHRIRLRHEESGAVEELANDFVFAMTGYCTDPALVRALGVEIDAETQIPAYDPDTMETNVPGVYVAGVLVGGTRPDKVFIETGRLHGPLIVRYIRERLRAAARVGQRAGSGG